MHTPSLLGLGLGVSLLLTGSAQPQAAARASDDAGRSRQQLAASLDKLASESLAARRATVAAITSRQQAEARQQQVREKILSLLGGLPGSSPLRAIVTGTTHLDGLRIEKVLFESMPNHRVTALLYLPEAAAAAGKRLPAIVVSPGHSPAGKASDYAMASAFARNGFIVLSYDILGEGERLQYPDPAHPGASLAERPTGEHGLAGLQPALLGDSIARYFVWDAMRAVDYLVSRPEVDASRIGAFGCSGGGTVTAMLGALDPRIHAVTPACYITSFDQLLPAVGAQDAEQSIPGFIASGFDLADWVELAAPRPYAIISTTADMFPFAGARASVHEARRFYSLFDPTASGSATPASAVPQGPSLNPDSTTPISPAAPLQWITGPGGHGNLRPLEPEIVAFFLRHLANSDAAYLPPPASATPPAAATFQVTSTGQVLTSYPNSDTIQSINMKRYALVPRPAALSSEQLAAAVRDITHATARPGDAEPASKPAASSQTTDRTLRRLTLTTAPGITVQAEFYRPSAGRHPALLLLKDSLDPSLDAARADEIASFRKLAEEGTAVLVLAPRPSPPGTEESKSPLLGSFYLTTLRAELVDRTLLGLRIDDVIAATNWLSNHPAVDPLLISARASGYMGLVLLHAATLDGRLKQVRVDHVLPSYRDLIAAPVPSDSAEDILPGVVRRYDIPDLLRVLGPRVTFTEPRSLAPLTPPAPTNRSPHP